MKKAKKAIIGIILGAVFVAAFCLVLFGGVIAGFFGSFFDKSDKPAEDIPYNYDLSEYVTVGKFPDADISRESIDAMIADELKQLATAFAESVEVTDRAVEDGDTVNIDYVGTLDGVAFEGGTAQGAELVIGSNSYIDGFETGLIGKNIGEEVALDLSFPDPYQPNPDLSGKAVVFTVKINKITTKVIPEINDELIKKLKSEDYATVEEFKKFYYTDFAKQVAWNTFTESCSVKKYPEKEVNDYAEKMKEAYAQQASMYGMDLSTFIAYMGTTEEQFNNEIVEIAKQNAFYEMIVYSVVRSNNIKVTDEEYNEYALEFAKQNNYTTVEEIEEAAGKDIILINLYREKVLDMILKANGIG